MLDSLIAMLHCQSANVWNIFSTNGSLLQIWKSLVWSDILFLEKKQRVTVVSSVICSKKQLSSAFVWMYCHLLWESIHCHYLNLILWLKGRKEMHCNCPDEWQNVPRRSAHGSDRCHEKTTAKVTWIDKKTITRKNFWRRMSTHRRGYFASLQSRKWNNVSR